MQVMHELHNGYTQCCKHFRVGYHIVFPPPVRDRPDTLVQAGVDASDEAVAVENRQDIVAPATQMFRFVDFPDVIKIEDLAQRLAIP